MADNYLERKFEELASRAHKRPHPIGRGVSLNSLLLKNRSYRGYNPEYRVSKEELTEIINVNSLTPSTRNQQILRFLPLCGGEAEEITPLVKMGGALPELHLPVKGSEPNSYIIVCSIVPEDKWVWVDLGISVQSMLLKSVDMGLNGLCIGSFNREKVAEIVKAHSDKELYPLLVLAIGKGAEHIQILPIHESDNHNYFRENNIHYVPKLKKEELCL